LGHKEEEEMMNIKWFFTGIACALILMISPFACVYTGGYKDGQIDAVNGVIKYELQKQVDESVIWTEIK